MEQAEQSTAPVAREPKVVYGYDPETQRLTGPTLADPDPMEEDNWLYPAHTVEAEPPPLAKGMTARWSGAVWEPTPIHDAPTLATPAEELTADQVRERERKLLPLLVMGHLDAKAQQMGYSNMQTAVSYAEEPAVAKFQAEGKALRRWRSLVWERATEIINEVNAGAPVPEQEAFIAQLPKLE